MSDKAKEDMIDNFVGITGVDKDRAKFYLESSAWKLDLAMASFYEGDPDDDELTITGTSQGIAGNQPDLPVPISQESGQSGQKRSRQTAPRAPPSRFATIGSMRDDEKEESSSEDEGQAFYAGGSERSGQQIIGPKKKNKNLVENIFKSAKEHGAEEVQDEVKPSGSRPMFRGSGYRLGETEGEPIEKVAGAPHQEIRRQVDCVLKLWKDGFSVDDGPLRDYKDPNNRAFLNSVSSGEIPQELIRAAKGGEVNLNMEDHRQEDYVKPKVPVRAFAGEGHTLGSPVPNIVASSSTPAGSTSSAPTSTIKVDESKPSTSLQIRLADGSRLVAKFNHMHTVGDVRTHIISLRPQYAGAQFVLQTTFPNRELTDDSETIEGAKLLNAVVVQRMK